MENLPNSLSGIKVLVTGGKWVHWDQLIPGFLVDKGVLVHGIYLNSSESIAPSRFNVELCNLEDNFGIQVMW